jgi:protein O-mannosyl-transferase
MKSLNPPEQPNVAAPQQNSKLTVPGVCIFLTVAVFLIFGQTLWHGFVNFDDDEYVYENPHLIKGFTVTGILWAFIHSHSNNWHPLTWLSHMLDCQLYGLNAGGHHLTNVLLHTATVILLFLVLRQMTKTLWPSALVAAVFAIHPLRVESVAWVAERKDVLSGLFFMLTLLMYARYVEKSKVQSPKSKVFYGLMLFFFTLGLMSKPMLVTLPFVLLLLDYWPLARFSSTDNHSPLKPAEERSPNGVLPPQFSITLRLLVEKLPFLALSIASSVVTVFAQWEAVAPVEKLPIASRICNVPVTYITFLEQMVYPARLAVFYPYSNEKLIWNATLALVLLAGISAQVFAWRRVRPYLLVGWMWYLGMLVPVIGLVQVGGQAHADRYTYLPLIGVFIMLTWAAADLFSSWRYHRQVLGAGALVVIVALMVCAWNQTSYWRNSESLWIHTLACTSGNYTAYNNLGHAIASRGRFAEATEYFQKALEINRDGAKAYNNWGTILLEQRRFTEAGELFQKTIQIKPDFAEAHNNLGTVLANQGRPAEAIPHFQEALKIKPDYAKAHYNWGTVLVDQGRPAEAIPHFQTALEIKPDYPEAHYNLGIALEQTGKFNEVIGHYEQALKIKPDYAEAHYRLALALKDQGRFESAIAHCRKVLELEPRHMLGQNNLAWLLATCPDASLRNGRRAVALAQQAEQLSGGRHPEILDTLAAAYAEAGQFPEAIETAERALHLVEAKTNTALADPIRKRLQLYEAKVPYHEKP